MRSIKLSPLNFLRITIFIKRNIDERNTYLDKMSLITYHGTIDTISI